MDIDPKDLIASAGTAAEIALAIALLAVTALTGLWPLFWVALVPTGFGVLMGLSGLMGLPIHPEALLRLLS